jgi:hypothetical protein
LTPRSERFKASTVAQGFPNSLAEIPSYDGKVRSFSQVSIKRPSLVNRIFLLSPANLAGVRGKQILSKRARFETALRLRGEGLPLGDLFAFVSGLYFRGKLAYAGAFAQAPPGTPAVFVITTSHGLVPPERVITRADVEQMTSVPIDPADGRYRDPLRRDLHTILASNKQDCEIVLLGSIATPKYVEPLVEVLGERLLFPQEFVGRGDMSRGGLMLRCAKSGKQLTYIPVATAVRHGARPPSFRHIDPLRELNRV